MSAYPAATALIVVDVQQSFPQRPYFRPDDVPAFLSAQNALIAGFAERGLPIVRVLHVEGEGAFALASGLVRPLDGLSEFAPALTLHKHAHSAFAAYHYDGDRGGDAGRAVARPGRRSRTLSDRESLVGSGRRRAGLRAVGGRCAQVAAEFASDRAQRHRAVAEALAARRLGGGRRRGRPGRRAQGGAGTMRR